MEFESIKVKATKETLDKMFGDRESAKEIKQAILLAQTGKLTDEIIEQYKKHKEQEYEMIKAQFDELNPSYAFDYPKETETIVFSNDTIKDDGLPKSR
jgi:hypothetical protein